MDYEFQLHPPKDLLEGADTSYDGTMFWKVEETAWTKNRVYWGWTTPCQICGGEPSVWTQEKGYRCWGCYAA